MEEGSCLRKVTAEKVEAGRLVTVGLGNQAKKEVVGMIGLVEGRCGFQEVHWEVEDSIPHVPQNRSLEVVEWPSRPEFV